MGNSSHLSSPELEIVRLRFVRLPTRSTKAVKAVRTPSGYVILLANGAIVSSAIRMGFSYPATASFVGDLIPALVGMGVVSKEAGERHLEIWREDASKSRRKRCAEDLIHAAKNAKVTLSKTQLAIVKKLTTDPVTPSKGS